jgi:hypothetical protein
LQAVPRLYDCAAVSFVQITAQADISGALHLYVFHMHTFDCDSVYDNKTHQWLLIQAIFTVCCRIFAVFQGNITLSKESGGEITC